MRVGHDCRDAGVPENKRSKTSLLQVQIRRRLRRHYCTRCEPPSTAMPRGFCPLRRPNDLGQS